MNEIYRLIYISEAHQKISYTDIDNILNVARIKNYELNITGILIYKDDMFVQLLEGPKSNVQNLLAKITNDPRHKNVRVIKEWDSNQPRAFEKWSMTFLDSDIKEKNHDFIQRLFNDAILTNSPTEDQFQIFFSSLTTTEN